MNEFICYCPNLYCKCKSGCNCLREKTIDIQLDDQWCLCCELAKINYQQKKQLGNDVKKMELETGEDKLYGKVILNSGKIIKSNSIELSSSRGYDCNIKNIELNDNVLEFIKTNTSDNFDLNFNTLLTNNDITNISLEGLMLNFNYVDATKNTTVDLPNSITNITSSNNALTMSKISGSSTANIINNLSLSVNNKKLQLNINGETTTIPLNNLQTTQDGDPITCTMNTFECDYIKHTYEIGCCGNKQTLKIFNDYHDIVTLDENGKYKSIIFSNYYTLENDELKFDIELTLNNLNYSLMLGGTKIIGAEELQNKVYSANFTGVFENISELIEHQNYSKLKKIWCNDDYANKLSSNSIAIIKFE